MTVVQWMTTAVVTIKPQATLRQARELMATHRINQLPVVVNHKLVGIVTDRDLRDAYPSSLRLVRGTAIDDFADSYPVAEVMTYHVTAVSPQTSLREAAQCLRRQRFGALPVVEHGTLVGILTRSDLLDALLAGESRHRSEPTRPGGGASVLPRGGAEQEKKETLP
jgi:acetoin utilization protein AcuB